MFVIKKVSKKKYSIIVISILVVTLLIISLTMGNSVKSYAVCSSIGKYSLSAQTIEEQIEFLEQFYWETGKEPTEVVELIIPQEFNEVYTNYNQIQIAQGLDLNKYKGKDCIKVSYDILNYPTQSENIVANMLIYDGKVIAGDISSIKLDGFMHGFEYKEE